MQADPPSPPPPPPLTHLQAARDVLTLEARALTRLAEALTEELDRAAAAILAGPGRVVVSGIGKSGHVGRKIAATLASTGTPAVFVHAAEAAHGDLGMITEDDICILLSNSGESAELVGILAYAGRFGIPVIGISSKADSTLMQAAAYRLVLPPVPEACPIGMAPTTSTTMMMALGDAIAVALMRARGFDMDAYRHFHPGGKLGAQMHRVADLMHGAEDLPLVDQGTPMPQTLLVMSAKGFGIAAVVGPRGRLRGVVTDGDLRRHMDQLDQATAGSIATPDPVTVTPDMLAAQALGLMHARKISVLLVVDETGHPIGVLHIHDLLRAGVA